MGKKGSSFPIQRYKYLGEQMFDYFVNDGFLCMLHSHRTSVACVACRSRVAKIILVALHSSMLGPSSVAVWLSSFVVARN